MNTLEALFSKARAQLLRLLFTDIQNSYYMRDLARQSGMAIGTIQREVAHLSSLGLILEKRDGNRRYFSANPQHPIAEDLHRLVLKTCGLEPQFLKALNPLEGIQLAFIYGSSANGKETPESDIDLMIIGTIGLRKLAPALRPLADTLNREINPTVYSPASFMEKQQSKDAFIQDVTRAPKLWILGNDDELAAMAKERMAT